MNPRSAAVQIVRPSADFTGDGPPPVTSTTTSNAGAAVFVPAGKQAGQGQGASGQAAQAAQAGSGSGKKGASMWDAQVWYSSEGLRLKRV